MLSPPSVVDSSLAPLHSSPASVAPLVRPSPREHQRTRHQGACALRGGDGAVGIRVCGSAARGGNGARVAGHTCLTVLIPAPYIPPLHPAGTYPHPLLYFPSPPPPCTSPRCVHLTPFLTVQFHPATRPSAAHSPRFICFTVWPTHLHPHIIPPPPSPSGPDSGHPYHH